MTKKKIMGFAVLTAIFILGRLSLTNIFAASDFVIETRENAKVLVEYKGSSGEVTVPNGVRKIGEDAFAGNKKVQKVVLPDSVKEIRAGAFDGCTNLKEIKLSKNLTRIWTGAFRQCRSLKTVKLNKKLRKLDEHVFAGCSSLEKVTVEKGSKYFKVKKGALLSKNTKKLYLYPTAMKTATSYTIPESVKVVYGSAFSKNKYLTKIIVKGKISSGESAFSGCKVLKEIEFKKPYQSGVDLSDCKKLKNVILAEGTKRIGDEQFDGCTKLKNINFPSGLEYIGTWAFRGCRNIKKPELPESVVVEKNAFDTTE